MEILKHTPDGKLVSTDPLRTIGQRVMKDGKKATVVGLSDLESIIRIRFDDVQYPGETYSAVFRRTLKLIDD